MYHISSIALKGLNPATLATTLALAAIFTYPSKTLAQTPSVPTNDAKADPQLGCLSGYPNGTYQGDRPLTRNEFAAALYACLNQLNQLLPVNTADEATKADFEALIQRQRELNQQLRELNSRVGVPPAKK